MYVSKTRTQKKRVAHRVLLYNPVALIVAGMLVIEPFHDLRKSDDCEDGAGKVEDDQVCFGIRESTCSSLASS